MTRFGFVFCAVLSTFLTSTISAQEVRSLRVEEVRYDGESKLLHYTMRNDSDRAMTSYAFDVVTRLEDGQELKSRITGPFPGQTFGYPRLEPGESFTSKVFPLRSSALPTQAHEIIPVVVIFVDLTFEGEAKKAASILHKRERDQLARHHWIQNLRGMLEGNSTLEVTESITRIDRTKALGRVYRNGRVSTAGHPLGRRILDDLAEILREAEGEPDAVRERIERRLLILEARYDAVKPDVSHDVKGTPVNRKPRS